MNTNQNRPISLRAVVAELLSCCGQVNARRSSQIINSVPGEIMITRSGNWLAPLMGDLYAIISSATEDEVVYISAKSDDSGARLYAIKRLNEVKSNASPVSSQPSFRRKNIVNTQFYFGYCA